MTSCRVLPLLLPLALCVLQACGDDDGGSSPAGDTADAVDTADTADTADTTETDATETDTADTSGPANTAPTATITAPSEATSIATGESVTFSGTCVDAEGDDVTHLWTFDGAHADSEAASPGAVTFATAGEYTVTYVCTDDGGLASDAETVVITVADAAGHALDGVITFDKVPSGENGLAYADTVVRPVRGAEVRIVADDDLDTILATAVTDDAGAYHASWPADGPDAVRVVVLARTADPVVSVRDNTAGDALYSMSSATVDTTTTETVDLHAASGWNGTAYDARAAAPFAVLDAAWQAVTGFLEVRPAAEFPDITLYWSESNAPTDPQPGETEAEAIAAGHIGTSHWDGQALYILGLEDADTDEFDDHTIVHEWGHYFQAKLSRSDSPGGAHASGELKDPRLAFGEGWGNALGAMIWYPNTVYADASGVGQAEGFTFDVEDNDGEDSAPGWYSEASVQTVLFDLFDDSGDAEAFDGVALGLGPFFDVLTGPLRTTPALTTIHAFVAELKAASPGESAAIDALLAHNEVVGAAVADEFGTGETKDGGDASNLPLYHDLDGGPVTVTLVEGPSGNTLGQVRYLVFTGDGAAHTVSMTTTSGQDLDLVVYRAGAEVARSANEGGDEETEAFATEDGAVYVVVVSPYDVVADCQATVTVND